MKRLPHVTVAILCLLVAAAQAEPIRILSWNVESDRPETDTDQFEGNDPATIADQLEDLQENHGPYHIIGLTEVRQSNANRYEQAIENTGANMRPFLSGTGGTDRMLLLVDEDRFEFVGDAEELEEHEGTTFPGGTARRPLVVHLRDTESDDIEFLFVLCHFTRGNAANRRRQAEGLREWARDKDLPIIACGDYNLDFNFLRMVGNRAYSILLEGGVWQWVLPGLEMDDEDARIDRATVTFVNTSWADDDPDASPRSDQYPHSVLDFVFVAGDAQSWNASSQIIVRPDDFPDTADTSDHRPVEATIEPE